MIKENIKNPLAKFALTLSVVFLVLLFITKTISSNIGLDEKDWISYIIYLDIIYIGSFICVLKFLFNIKVIMNTNFKAGVVTVIGTVILAILLLDNYEIIATSLDLMTSNSEIALIGKHYNAFAVFSNTSMNQLMIGFIVFGIIEYFIDYINFDLSNICEYMDKASQKQNIIKQKILRTQKLNVEVSSAFLLDESNGNKYFISKEEFYIGKTLDNDLIVLEDYISRKHAVIIQMGDEFCLMDNGSSNHTYVNDKKLEDGKGYSLQDGDNIKFAKKQYIFNNHQGISI